MHVSVAVEKAADHPLMLGAVLLRLVLEKINASSGKGKSDLHRLFLKERSFGAGRKS